MRWNSMDDHTGSQQLQLQLHWGNVAVHDLVAAVGASADFEPFAKAAAGWQRPGLECYDQTPELQRSATVPADDHEMQTRSRSRRIHWLSAAARWWDRVVETVQLVASNPDRRRMSHRSTVGSCCVAHRWYSTTSSRPVQTTSHQIQTGAGVGAGAAVGCDRIDRTEIVVPDG